MLPRYVSLESAGEQRRRARGVRELCDGEKGWVKVKGDGECRRHEQGFLERQ